MLSILQNRKSSPKKGQFKEKVQLFARGLLVPITLLAFAGLFLGIGAVIGKYVTDGAGNTFANVIKNVGNVVFYLLPLLFAIAIASSLTNNNGTAILAAVVAWVAIQMISGAMFVAMPKATPGWSWFGVIDFEDHERASIISKTFGFSTLDISVFGGFLAGPLAVYAYNKFQDQKMPVFLQMFQGQRFVPIMALVLSIPVSFLVSLIWPWVSKGFIAFGQASGKLPGGLDSFLFGVLERALLPTGLHHMFYSPLLYTSAGGTVIPTYQIASEVSVAGATFKAGMPLWAIDAAPFLAGAKDVMPDVEGIQIVNLANVAGVTAANGVYTVTDVKALEAAVAGNAFSEMKTLYGDRVIFQTLNGSAIQFQWINELTDDHSIHLGRFAAGKFPMMVFGIPAAGAAMIFAAPKANRKLVTGVVGSAALTSFLTGITEPFEYSFLFLAPVLFYGFHIWMAGLSYLLANVAGVYYGPTFGGIVDYAIYGIAPHASGQITNFYWLLVIGLGLAGLYFTAFYFLIKKLNLPTPGRGGQEIKLFSKEDYKNSKEAGTDALSIKGQIMYKALGGKENLTIITNCASRLRVTVKDPSKVDYDLAQTTQPYGVVGKGKTAQQYIYGPAVQTIADTVTKLFEGKIKPLENIDSKATPVAKTESKTTTTNAVSVLAPVTGKLQPVKKLKDGVFSEGMMGEGVYIELAGAKAKEIMYAPITGELVTVFPTGHAYGIKTKEGFEVLLHIGVDTVNLKGEGFKSLVKQGQQVKAGEPLVEVNTKLIEKKVPSINPILLFTSGQKLPAFKDGKVATAKKAVINVKG